MSGFDRSSGFSSSSTAAKKASRSTCPMITGEPYSGAQPFDPPGLADPLVQEPVVKPVVVVNPELVALRHEPVTAPGRRSWDIAGILRFGRDEAFLQDSPRGQALALA